MEQGCSLRPRFTSCVSACFAAVLLFASCAGEPESPTVSAPEASSEVQPHLSRAEEGLGAVALRYRASLIRGSRREGSVTESARQRLGLLLKQSEEELNRQDSQEELVEAVLAIGRIPTESAFESGFIESPTAVEILVIGLSSEHPTVAQRALTYLLEYAKPNSLAKLASTIRSGLEQNPHPDGDRLLALLPMEPEAREAMLASSTLAADIRARLGDPIAEGKIVRAFREATEYGDKRTAAKALGYAGTSACKKALLDAFDSELANRTPYFDRSIRCDLLEQLARIDPEEPLFTTEYRRILSVGEDKYGLDPTRQFLSRVVELAVELGVDLESLSEDPLLVRMKLVKRPIRK